MANLYNEILHERVSYEKSYPSVTPIFQTSGFNADSNDFYARKSTPNSTELENILKKMEGSEYALSVSTGMSAIFLCLNLLHQGNRVLICSKIYGCSYKLFKIYCQQHAIELDILDITNKEEYEKIKNKIYDMCFFETPTNPFLDTVDIYEISIMCKARNSNCIIIVDNTWATPIYQKPLNFGADIVVYSGTKYFSGHSDVMCGFITTNNNMLFEKILEWRFYCGLILTPFHAWLVRRSLQTFQIRMEQQKKTTIEIKNKLKDLKFIRRIYYPNIDGKQLTNYGGIIFIEVEDDIVKKYEKILKKLRLFGNGTGMACVTSMIAQPYTGSHASLSVEEKLKMGISPNLLRLCFGLEEPDALYNDLLQAFTFNDTEVFYDNIK